jgi:micrococcal nuclease
MSKHYAFVKLGLALVLVGSAATPSAAEAVQGERVIIIDGDTVAIGHERVRLLDIDAPETSKPRCEAELARGLEAKSRLRQLVRGASLVTVDRTGEIDRYGRTLGRLKVDGRDVGDILMREGMAVRWTAGRQSWEQRAQHWCVAR